MAEKTVERALAVGGDIAAQLVNTIYGEVPMDVVNLKLPKEGRYDVIIVWNALQFIPARKVDKFMQDMKYLLKKGGFIYLYTTAVEWIAEQILQYDPTIPWRPMLFGVQSSKDTYAKNALSMLDLRNLVETAGLHAVNAETGSYTVEDTKVGQHLVVCYLPEGDTNAPAKDPPKRLRRTDVPDPG